VASVDETLSLLVSDREFCMDVLSDLSDERLLSERSVAPHCLGGGALKSEPGFVFWGRMALPT